MAHVAGHMRPGDWEECEAAYGRCNSPRDVLFDSVARSEFVRCAMTRDGEPVAIFGVMATSFLSKQGSIWMIATPAFARHTRESIRLARRLLPRLHADFGELVNYVYHKNHASLRWLARLGFDVRPAAPYGAYRQPFHQVVKRVDACATQAM